MAAGEDVRKVLAAMTKASLDKKRGGARAERTKRYEPATALNTMTLTVRALRKRMYHANPELRVKNLSLPRLNDVIVHSSRSRSWPRWKARVSAPRPPSESRSWAPQATSPTRTAASS